MRTLAALWTLAAGAAVAAGLAEERLLSDDAYYYFEIARNAALGLGPGFDSLAPTNGFHPLWAGVLVPVFAVWGDAYWLPIRAALFLSVLCVAGCAVGMQALLARLGAPRAGELAACIWLLNPFSLALAFRGMETPLLCLLLTGCCAWLVRVRRRRAFGVAELALLGAALGACALARTDALLFAAAAAGVVAADALRAGRARALAVGAAAAAGAALAVLSPWLLWSLRTFGSVVQSSQEAKQRFELYGSLPGGILDPLVDALLVPVRFAVGEEFGELRRGGLLLVGVVLFALALIVGLLRARRTPAARLLLAPLALYLALHFAATAAVLGSYASWYFLAPVWAVCLLTGVALVGAESLDARRYAALLTAWIALWAAAGLGLTAPLFGAQPAERQRSLAALGQALPPDATVGLWNAGELGYFFSLRFPDVRVVNLDGVVNNELLRLERDGGYEQYLLDRVDLLLEPPQPYLTQVIGAERARRFERRHLHPAQRGGWTVFEVVR